MPKEENVSDEALTAALEGTDEPAVEPTAENSDPVVEEVETVEEVVDEEPTKEEPLSHGESSRMGRKLKRLQEEVAAGNQRHEETMAQMASLTAAIANQNNGPVTPEVDAYGDPITDETTLTRGDLGNFLKEYEAKKVATSQQYENDFIGALAEQTEGMDDATLELVAAEVEKAGNQYYTGKASVDAGKSLNRALQVVMKKNVENKNPLKGPRSGAATGLSGSEVVKGKEVAAPVLSPDELALVSSSNLTEDEVKAALTGDASPALSGGRRRMNGV